MKVFKKVTIANMTFLVLQPTLKDRFNEFIEKMYEIEKSC